MPRISQARRTLTRLLEVETDPQKKADLAAKLATVVHQENLERGRKRRARRDKPEPVTPPRDDSNDPFQLYEEYDASPYPPPFIPPSSTPPAAPAAPPPPPALEPEPEIEAPRPDGYSRVLFEYCEPTMEETYPTARDFRFLRYVDPLADLGGACMTAGSFSVSGEFVPIEEQIRREAEAAERKRVDAAWTAFKESIYVSEEVVDAENESSQ
jgi:hypothetical protein